MTRLFEGQAGWQPILVALLPTLLIAFLAARAARRLARNGLQSMLGDTIATSSPLVRAPLRLVAIGVFVVVTGVLLFPAFQLAGLRPTTGLDLRTVTAWTFGSGLRVVIIALAAYALIRATDLLVKRFEFEVAQGSGIDALERGKRARTLGAVVSKSGTILIAGVAALMILREFEIDIAPVLTGAGIAGLAIGFGAQTLVRDIISGFFLILEDQVRVGDVAAIDGTGGLVEAINLRTIVLRDLEGTVHVFPNGSITTLSNRTKDFSYYVVDLAVSYREDSDRVIAVLKEVGEDLRADPQFAPFILEPLEVLGVDAFAETTLRIKLRLKTVPLKQWEVGRELRRRIKKAFDSSGIRLAVPQRVVTVEAEEPDR